MAGGVGGAAVAAGGAVAPFDAAAAVLAVCGAVLALTCEKRCFGGGWGRGRCGRGGGGDGGGGERGVGVDDSGGGGGEAGADSPPAPPSPGSTAAASADALGLWPRLLALLRRRRRRPRWRRRRRCALLILFGLLLLGVCVAATSLFGGLVAVAVSPPASAYAVFRAVELAAGLYTPALASLRAPLVPDGSRAALLTYLRLPPDRIVVAALTADLRVRTVVGVCAALLGVEAATMARLAFLQGLLGVG